MKHTICAWMAVVAFGWLPACLSFARAAPCIGVVPAGGGHVFWDEIENGARRAGRALGVDIYFRGPGEENRPQAQNSVIEIVERMKCMALVVAPAGPMLKDDVARLRTLGIPTVYLDREYPGAAVVAVVATDNYRAGVTAAETLAGMLPPGAPVGLLRMNKGVPSTDAREAGFLATATERGLSVVLDVELGERPGEARERAVRAFTGMKVALAGVFAPNELTSSAVVAALRQTGLAGRVKFIGFDASQILLNAMRAGDVSGLVVQRPERMGYESVMRAWEAAKAPNVPNASVKQPLRVDTGVFLVEPSSLDSAAMRATLSSYLGPVQ